LDVLSRLPFLYLCVLSPARYAVSLHDALPIYRRRGVSYFGRRVVRNMAPHDVEGSPSGRCARPSGSSRIDRMRLVVQGLGTFLRSEEHTSELQSRFDLVCRLPLEK